MSEDSVDQEAPEVHYSMDEAHVLMDRARKMELKRLDNPPEDRIEQIEDRIEKYEEKINGDTESVNQKSDNGRLQDGLPSDSAPETIEEISDRVWEEHGEKLGRRTIGIDISFKEIVEIIMKEIDYE